MRNTPNNPRYIKLYYYKYCAEDHNAKNVPEKYKNN